MFFTSGNSSGTPSPHKQPLLSSPTTKKSASARFRNLLFHSLEPEEDEGSPTKAKSRTPTSLSSKSTRATTTTNNNQPGKEAPTKSSNPRDNFQRANSHPIRLDASAALSASRSYDPSMSRAAALVETPTKPASPYQPQPLAAQQPSIRSTVFGSCSHVLSAVITVLFHTLKAHGKPTAMSAQEDLAAPPPSDNHTLRKAKLLYIALLEKAQRERGEWQGFASSDINSKETEAHSDGSYDSTQGMLAASVRDASAEEAFAVLHELLELSFRNMRVALLPPLVYTRHRSDLENESLRCPASLTTLLRVSRFVGELSVDEKSCLLRLLHLWVAMCMVDPERELRLIVEEKHSLILNEASEMEFMQQSHKSARIDPTAVDLLVLMTQHREVLFPGLEFFSIRQEMHITTVLVDEPQFDTADESRCEPRTEEPPSVLSTQAEGEQQPSCEDGMIQLSSVRTLSVETQTEEPSLSNTQLEGNPVEQAADEPTPSTDMDTEVRTAGIMAAWKTEQPRELDATVTSSTPTRHTRQHDRATRTKSSRVRKVKATGLLSPRTIPSQLEAVQHEAVAIVPTSASDAAVPLAYVSIAVAVLSIAAASGLYAMRKSGN